MNNKLSFLVWHKLKLISSNNNIKKRYKSIKNNDYEVKTNRTFQSYIPISYNTLNSYGYKIISSRGWGKGLSSSYALKVMDYEISDENKDIYNTKILLTCPIFIKIYLKKLENNNAEIILVSKRLNEKERTEARIIGKINI